MKMITLAVAALAVLSTVAAAAEIADSCAAAKDKHETSPECVCKDRGGLADCDKDRNSGSKTSGEQRHETFNAVGERIANLAEANDKGGVFGFKGVGTTFGTWGGQGGSGLGGGLSVRFLQTHPKKFGYVTANANIPTLYHTNGIRVQNVDQIPGDPTDPTNPPLEIHTTVKSPGISYIPVAEVQYHPHDFLHGRVSPSVGGQFGATVLDSKNARVTGGTVYANLGGQLIPVDTVPPSLQPTGEKKYHMGGGPTAATEIYVAKGISVEPKLMWNPGYSTKSITVWFGRKKPGK